MKAKYFVWLAAVVLPSFLFVSCGDDDESESDGKINVEKQTGDAKTWNDSTAFNVDKSFVPSLSYIQKRWAGEYEGWDDVQKANTKIVRMLTLNSGTYENIIQGEIVSKGKSMSKFESERGTYTYNASTGIITYKVEADSVLVYDTQKFNVYSAKHYYDHTKPTYTEKAQFSVLTNGKRNWVTKDTYLQSLTAQKIDLTFDMVEDNGQGRDSRE